MFGYVKIDKPECKIREYEYYRGVYCGLCRVLGQCGGACARLTLSYDVVFLALVRMALEGEKPSFGKRWCIAHPMTRHIEAKSNVSLSFCARASLILSYHKLLDDLADEKGKKRLMATCLLPAFRFMSRRAAKGQDGLCLEIGASLEALAAFEKAPLLSLDRPAELFGETMARVLAFGLEGEQARIARAVGMAVGKWVYLVDALDDFDQDRRFGRYNPILLVYGDLPLGREARDAVRLALDACLAEAAAALDLLDFPDGDMKSLTENILSFGMPAVAGKFIEKETLDDEGSI